MDPERDDQLAATCSTGELESTLVRTVREEGVATRRHIDVVAARLRDDLRTIAQRLIALDAKVEALRDSR